MNKQNRLILIDGSAYIFRAYYGLPPMNRKDGTPINAVFGFTNMLVKLIEDYGDERLIVVFDAARENFRNEIYSEYKANRGETPEDLVPQFDLIKECVNAFNISQIELKGYEADDIIATFANLAQKENISTLIISSDKDLMQLVNSNVQMLDPIKNKSIGRIINIIRFLILKNEMSVPSMKVLNSGVTKLLNPKSVNPSMVWDNYCIKRYLDKLYFLELSELQPNKCNKLMNWSIDQPLILDEDGSTLAATMTKGQGLSVKKCNKNLDVQFRKGGESMRPVGHKITKKLKKLFQEDHILPWTRDKIPLLYKKNELIGVGDLWFNQHYIASAEEDGFLVNWSRNISIKHN